VRLWKVCHDASLVDGAVTWRMLLKVISVHRFRPLANTGENMVVRGGGTVSLPFRPLPYTVTLTCGFDFQHGVSY